MEQENLFGAFEEDDEELSEKIIKKENNKQKLEKNKDESLLQRKQKRDKNMGLDPKIKKKIKR